MNVLICVMHLRQSYEKVLQKCSEKLGITQLEINILLFLLNHSEYNTARDICNMRMIPKSNTSNGIRLLERKGLLRIEQDGEKMKLHRLFLTEKSKHYTDYLQHEQKRFLEDIAGALEPQEWESLLKIMCKLDSYVQNKLGRH